MKQQYLHNVSTLELYRENCTGCGICINVCPHNVFMLSGNKAEIIERDRCMECGACEMNCAFNAISVKKGVGCAAAVINSFFRGTDPECGCSCN